ncbi:MAG: HAD family hydrolase [Janthinobacterium lividum]
MTTQHAVLFDLDGTLVDSNELHVAAWRDVFAQAGHDVSDERIRGQIGKGGDKLVPALLPGVTKDEQEALSEAHGDVFTRHYRIRVRPFPGARVLLARVAETETKVVFASSASKGDLDHYLGLLDARHLVATATTIDDVTQSKPAPDIFATALKKAGVAPDAAVALGDSPFDMIAARDAGIAAVAVRSGGFDDGALAEAGAIAIYDNVADLLAQFAGSPLDRA